MDLEVWRAIIGWSLQDVIDIHARHNIHRTRFTRKGFTRGVRSLYHGAEEGDHAHQPVLSAADRPHPGAGVCAERSTRVHRDGAVLFQAKLPEVSIGPGGEKVETYPAWPIDLVVAWSKTPHGGRETGQS